MPISPARVMRAVSQAQQLIAGLELDDRLRLGTIEGETDAFEIIDRLLEEAAAAGSLADIARARARSFEAREERLRGVVARMLEALELKLLERPMGTLSVVQGPVSVVISDPAAIPPRYLMPSKAAIGRALRAGEAVPGCSLNNGPPALRILVGRRAVEQDDAA